MTKTIEVNNVWAIYGLEEDGSEAKQPLALADRPQDWGDPERWSYHRFRFEWLSAPNGVRYINHFHGWTDLKLNNPGDYPNLFAHLVVMVMQPSTAPQLCGRDYLHPEDFWLKKWGPRPPFYDGPRQVFGNVGEQPARRHLQVDEGEALALMARAFDKEPAPATTIGMPAFNLFRLLGLIQFASRGLPPEHRMHGFARLIGEQMTAALIAATGEPELRRYVELGWDPAYDVVQPNEEPSEAGESEDDRAAPHQSGQK